MSERAQEFVRRVFGGTDPIDRRIQWGRAEDDSAPADYVVVGVSRDVKRLDVFNEMAWKSEPEIFIPYAQAPAVLARAVEIFVRVAGDPAAIEPALPQEVARLDPALPIYRLRITREWLADQVNRPRFRAQAMGFSALLALVLTGVGLYGVLMQIVMQRRREIGVRIALGATAVRICAHMLHEAVAPTALGIAVGAAGATTALQLMRAFLVGVSPLGPALIGLAAGALVVIALAATAIPAARAARINPIDAIRVE
jgi:ABC-type antimicrobial peptide transport system permease subunit